jgi:hypothetical protein
VVWGGAGRVVACRSARARRADVRSPWLYYEAGAIAAKLTDTTVSPFLFGLNGEEIASTPFAQLQWTRFDKSDTHKLIATLCTALSLNHDQGLIDGYYSAEFPALKRKIDRLLSDFAQAQPKQNNRARTDQPKNLSTEAKVILVEASQDRGGFILIDRDRGGFHVQTNGKELSEPGNARVEAAYQAAIKELLSRELIETRKHDVSYALTADGFKYADTLRGSVAAPDAMHEKLLELYTELVAIAATELDRVKSIEASIAIGDPKGEYTEALKLDHQRHSARADLLKVTSQLKLYETDQDLLEKAEGIAKSQPFMSFTFPPRFGEGNYNERFDKYQADVRAFESLLQNLIATIRKTHPPK